METPTGSDAGSFCSAVSTVPTLVDALEANFAENRLDLLSDDGIVISPLGILKELASEYGVKIEEKNFEIHLQNFGEGPEAIRHRVILTVGAYNGHGETCRHRLALQLAAADLLEKMREQGHDIPSFGLLPGCRVNPTIYHDLKELCDMKNLAGPPSYQRVHPSVVGSDQSYGFKCTIGNAHVVGVSDSIFLAKRLSAKKMYEELTGEPYPDDRIATGAGCLTIDDLHLMGINPQTSTRAQQRELDSMAEPEEDDKLKVKAPQKGKKKGYTFDEEQDGYGEVEDAVGVIGNQIELIEITDAAI